MKKHKIQLLYGGIAAILLMTACICLKTDVVDFLKWYLAVFLLGICAIHVTSRFFPQFADKGWLFSKVVGLAICGYTCWLFPALRLIPFTKPYTIGITVILVLGMVYPLIHSKKYSDMEWDTVIQEELIFLALFLLWTYLAGFRPELHGTEKPMDYGFMAAINRSSYFPPADIWYGGEDLNYYYGGQYFAVYLSRIAFVQIEKGYHLMKAFIAAMAFCLPFSLCSQMLTDSDISKRSAVIGGTLSGFAISFCGNLHYVIFGLFRNLFQIDGDYTFSSSTRFIGYVPDTADKTIHEFPVYSFLLGDLHAHVVNVLFVLLFLGIIYNWIIHEKEQKTWLKYPAVCSFLLGLFLFTNTWDWPIYLTVGCGACLFWTIRQKAVTCVIGGVILISGSLITSAPFLYQFHGNQAISGIGIAKDHSALWQLLLLWGLPFFTCILFLVILGTKYRKTLKQPDMYISLLSLCAMGLVMIPELIYVRDIYEQGYARCNTMFKLTYQAFILFGIAMGYIIVRLYQTKNRIFQICSISIGCILLLTGGYVITGAKEWYRIPDDGYETLDSTAFLTESWLDTDAVTWLEEHIESQPIVLTADGESYSNYCYLSAVTGIPTVLGWHTHEWLWRGSYEDVMTRSKDIEQIYSSDSKTEVEALLEKYKVDYIFIGYDEQEAYPSLNKPLLYSMGKIVFDNGRTTIIQL